MSPYLLTISDKAFESQAKSSNVMERRTEISWKTVKAISIAQLMAGKIVTIC